VTEGCWEAACVVVAGAVVGGAALPWHRSGTVRRNGFELARVADSLGLVSSGALRVLFVAVFLLPLLAALTLAAAAAGWHRAMGVAVGSAGVLGLAATMVALNAIGLGQPGPVVTGLAGAAAVGCGARTVRRGAHTDVRHP
jgi:hypothetical protein